MSEPAGQLIWRRSTPYGGVEIWRTFAAGADLYSLWFGDLELAVMTFPNPLHDALLRGDYDAKAGRALSRLLAGDVLVLRD